MKSIKIFSIDNEKKLALVNTLIFALIAAVLYFALPSVLNYPPNSTDNSFQIEIVGITYTTQFVIIISILLVLLYIALRFIYSKMSLSEEKLKNTEYIRKLRKKSFNYPYMMLLFEIFVPTIIIAILLFAFNTEAELVLRITTVVFSFSAVFAIFSYMLSKKFFSNRLTATAELANNEVTGVRLPLYHKLLIQILVMM